MTKFSTAGIQAGDPIYIASPGSWEVRITKRTATRVTPTGRVIWEYGDGQYKKTFGPDGDEIGGSSSKYRRDFLVSEERYNEHQRDLELKAQKRKIKDELEGAAKMNPEDLLPKLDEIRKMVEAVIQG